MRIQQISPQEYPLDLGLPWDQPLESWPAEKFVDVARGISRNIVRFVHYRDRVYAIKEISEKLARHEFQFLRDMQEMGAPSVQPVAVVTQRKHCPQKALLVTHYLEFSLPYRIIMSEPSWQYGYDVLIDAMAQLIVWLHLQGIFWGDCSLSNTLFRRDAGRLAAYFVDAETAESHKRISKGQRELDLMIAQTNVGGELLDLQSGFGLPEGVDPVQVTEDLARKYQSLWHELNHEELIGLDEQFRIEKRIQRLHDLGYEIEEMEFETTPEGDRLRLVTSVVEPGYHIRLLESLIGERVQANQARRLLGEINRFRARVNQKRKEQGGEELSETEAAQQWYQQKYLNTLRQIPDEYKEQMDTAEMYHQLLEHRWYESEKAQRDIGTQDAVESFIENVLKPQSTLSQQGN